MKRMLAAVVGLAATVVVAAPVPVPQPIALDATTTLLRGSFVADRQPDGNSVVLVGKTGVIVFDTGRHAIHTQAVADAIAASGKPLVAIVNSHWHLDHVSGNYRLKAIYPGAKVYATDAIDRALTGFLKKSAADARPMLSDSKVPADTLEDLRADFDSIDHGDRLRPDVVVAKSRDLNVGGRRLSLHVTNRGVTAADIWVEDKRNARVLAGDLVTLPAPFFDTACPQGWLNALDAVAKVRFSQLVPGHGPALSRDEFLRYRGALGRFVACAQGTELIGTCSAAWVSDLGSLVPAADMGRAKGGANYYTRLIRDGGLKKYCS